MRACEREGVPKCLQNAGAFLIAFRLLLLYFETTVWLCGRAMRGYVRSASITGCATSSRHIVRFLVRPLSLYLYSIAVVSRRWRRLRPFFKGILLQKTTGKLVPGTSKNSCKNFLSVNLSAESGGGPFSR